MAFLTGTAADDTLVGTQLADVISGEDGNDTLEGDGGDDILIGGAGGDALIGGTGVNELYSFLPGGNVIAGAPFDGISTDIFTDIDTLIGGPESDGLFAGYGDNVDGGGGQENRLFMSFMGAAAGVVADFRLISLQGSVIIGGGTIRNINRIGFLEGSNFSDELSTIDAFNPSASLIYGRGGDDILRIGPSLGAQIFGGDGNDTIYASGDARGEAGNDLIILQNGSFIQPSYGGDGDDEIRMAANGGVAFGDNDRDRLIGAAGQDAFDGGAGDDMLDGGPGNDRLDGGSGNDTLVGGVGDDQYLLDSLSDAIIENSNEGYDTLTASVSYRLGGSVSIERLDASVNGAIDLAGNEIAQDIYGNAEVNILEGLGGNDRLYGGAGNDILIGGAGEDFLIGDDGEDTASYASSATGVTVSTTGASGEAELDRLISIEIIVGSRFNDSLFAVSGINRVDGGNGNDFLFGGEGSQTLIGGEGDDSLVGNFGADMLIGGDGIDTAIYAELTGGVTVNLELGRGFNLAAQGDTFAGVENIAGTADSDILIGDAASNRLDGRDGADRLSGSRGADVLIGGVGNDTASYADDIGAVFINLTLGRGFGNAAEGDTLSGIENVIGSTGDDTIIGDGLGNRLDGDAGNDVLRGAFGADVLVGGAGIDTASYEDNQGAVFVDLLRGVGFNNSAQGDSFESIENLAGSIFGDVFIGTNDVNRIDGLAGNDTILGGLGTDTIVGGDGIDTASFEDNQGAVFVNLLLGQGFGNAAQGDTYGGIENLVGTVFYDSFLGDDGANRLDGARGGDLLIGNGGADVFAFTTALDGVSNIDTIGDFASGSDKIELARAIFAALPAGGTLAAGAFTTGTAATAAEQRIVYDGATGRLYYDADGNGAGAAVLFAVLDTKPTITATDFVVV